MNMIHIRLNDEPTGKMIALSILTAICVLIVEFFMTIGLTWIVFNCFDLNWSFEYGAGIFCIMCLVNMAVGSSNVQE